MLGEVIQGYRIDRVLSVEGGFGDVYLATHVESGAEAVVKVLKPEMSALRDIVARFFNEARAAASIHHPGIVQIHNVGYHGDHAYLLMERLRGDDLETRLKSGPLPLDRAIAFLRQTAGAIGTAHARGIVHRDLKPANLFIVEDPDVIGGERVKVLDFGIAKLTADTGAGKTQGVFGTPAYMSPEQCASTGAVDARADLYSLGCIFYELVCGRPPFGHGGLELIAAHLRDTPPPPRAVAPWVPPAIEQVILQLLEKSPDRRMPSCAALIAALDAAALSSGLPAGSMPPLSSGGLAAGASSSTTLGSSAGAASTMPARKRGLGLWIGLGSVVVAGGVLAAVMATRERTSVGSDGPTPSDAGVVLSASADTALLGGVSPDAVSLDAASQEPVIPDVVPLDAASVALAIPDAAPEKPRTLVSGDRTATTAPKVSSRDAHEVARLMKEANEIVLADSGRLKEALTLYQRAAAFGPNPSVWFNMGVIWFQMGHFGEADAALREVLALSPSEQLGNKAKRLLDKVHSEAKAQGIMLRGAELESGSSSASRSKRVAVEAKQTSPGEQVAKLSEAGKAEMYAERYDKALPLFQRAYEVEPTPVLLYNIGVAEHLSGRCREARRTFQRLMATWPTAPVAQKAQAELDRMKACQ